MGEGLGRRGLERHSMAFVQAYRWKHQLLQPSAALYLAATPLDSGSLASVGGRVTINKWMQESHGPSVTVVDASGAGLDAAFKFVGLDQFGRDQTFVTANLQGIAAPGQLHQQRCAFSYLQYIETVAISGAAAGDTVAVGVSNDQAADNLVWWGFPCNLRKSGDPVANYYQNDGSGVTYFAIDRDRMLFQVDLNITSVLDLVTIFDPRRASF